MANINFFKKPMFQIVAGFFLAMYGIFQRTGNALIDYIWLAIAIIGFALLFNGAKKLRQK